MHLEVTLDTWQTIPVPNNFKYIILPTFMFLIAEGDDVKEQESKKDMDTKNLFMTKFISESDKNVSTEV